MVANNFITLPNKMPRLYHTKSRTGCQRCRSRRVKCDENWPICGSCLRHGVECIFDRANRPSEADGANPRTQLSPSDDKGSDPSFIESRERRLRELELLQTFLVHTVPTMAGFHFPTMTDTWTIRVPTLAMSYDPLLSAIMLLASHQMVRVQETPEKVEHYSTLRSLYLGSTLQAHRPDLSSVTKENAEAVCFTALILSIDNMASLQDRPIEPYEPPLQWILLCKSIEGVWKFALDVVRHDTASNLIPATEGIIPWYREAKAFRPDRFSHLVQALEDEIIDEEDLKAYEETAGVLSWISMAVESGEELTKFCRRLRILPYLLSEHYIKLLHERDSRALVFLAHYFAITSYASELWWVGNSPVREVNAIKGFLSERWQSMLAWPLRVTQKQGERKESRKFGNGF